MPPSNTEPNKKFLLAIENYLAVPGGKIWYQKFFTKDNQDKTPIIILHGGPGFPHNYLENLASLAIKLPVIFYDQLGCGKSALSEENNDLWKLPRFIEELAILINHLGAKQVYLLGHSWGATIAAEYAIKNPHKIKKLILSSPLLSTPLWAKDTRYLLEQLPDVSRVVIKHELDGTYDSQEYQDATLTFYQHYLCRLPEWPEALKYSFEHFNTTVYKTIFGPSEFTVTGNLSDFDCLDQLYLLTMPTLITCGRFDEARPESMQNIVKKLPEGKLVIFEKSAHVAHLEESDLYLNVLTDFIEK